MRTVLLSRPMSQQGILTIEAFAREGLPISAVVLEPKPLSERRKRFLKVYRENGPFYTLLKVGRILVDDHLLPLLSPAWPQSVRTVAEACASHAIPAHTVLDHNGSECEALLRSLAPDLLLLAGTRIIKANVLAVPRIGTINAHPGWLPTYRGRNCNLWAFLEGGPTGISTHFVDPGVDTGPILLREPVPIAPGDTLEEIDRRAAAHCGALTAKTVRGLTSGAITPIPQRPEEGRQFPGLPVSQENEVRRRLSPRGGNTASELRRL